MKPRVWTRDTGPRVPGLQSSCHVTRGPGHPPHGVCHAGHVTGEGPGTRLESHGSLRRTRGSDTRHGDMERINIKVSIKENGPIPVMASTYKSSSAHLAVSADQAGCERDPVS